MAGAREGRSQAMKGETRALRPPPSGLRESASSGDAEAGDVALAPTDLPRPFARGADLGCLSVSVCLSASLVVCFFSRDCGLALGNPALILPARLHSSWFDVKQL